MERDRLTRLARIYRLQRTGQARSIRQRAGISASELARELGTQPKSMLRWEAGEVRPRAEAALRWLDALDALNAEQTDDEEEVLAVADTG